MPDNRYTPPRVPQARGAVAGLHSHGATPKPSLLDAAKATLCCSNIDVAIRRAVQAAGTAMNGAQVGHLVGLLLAESGVGASVIAEVESLTRKLVVAAQGGERS